MHQLAAFACERPWREAQMVRTFLPSSLFEGSAGSTGGFCANRLKSLRFLPRHPAPNQNGVGVPGFRMTERRRTTECASGSPRCPTEIASSHRCAAFGRIVRNSVYSCPASVGNARGGAERLACPLWSKLKEPLGARVDGNGAFKVIEHKQW
jgi:hypothetical protein